MGMDTEQDRADEAAMGFRAIRQTLGGCQIIDRVIHCQCGNPSSHYGTMGERGAREVREIKPGGPA